MRTEQTLGVNLTLLCSLSGHSRQAYYKYNGFKAQSQLQKELIIQQVMAYRKMQKKLGGRKLLLLLQPFMKQHGIHMGRDAFFGF
jgi:hypothetical protein